MPFAWKTKISIPYTHSRAHTHNVYHASQLCTQGNAFAIYFSTYKIKINRDKQPLICWYWAFGQIRPNTWYGHKNIPIPFHARTPARTPARTDWHTAHKDHKSKHSVENIRISFNEKYIVDEFRRHFVTDWQSVPLFVTHIRKMYFDTLRNNQNWGTTVTPKQFSIYLGIKRHFTDTEPKIQRNDRTENAILFWINVEYLTQLKQQRMDLIYKIKQLVHITMLNHSQYAFTF